ncbi:hypothetical protein DFP72DRAFT_1083750 [Ephemerocybe angulata]|uniref:Uncharacterized protein n=1 Tax=Ephemerocybe angulata TaxID=980116 RepID=A0A8H6H8J4_9AGAR|nr:hypothetical protein DFP72DRAFT_1083750 [Tulosesus angulatus]
MNSDVRLARPTKPSGKRRDCKLPRNASAIWQGPTHSHSVQQRRLSTHIPSSIGADIDSGAEPPNPKRRKRDSVRRHNGQGAEYTRLRDAEFPSRTHCAGRIGDKATRTAAGSLPQSTTSSRPRLHPACALDSALPPVKIPPPKVDANTLNTPAPAALPWSIPVGSTNPNYNPTAVQHSADTEIASRMHWAGSILGWKASSTKLSVADAITAPPPRAQFKYDTASSSHKAREFEAGIPRAYSPYIAVPPKAPLAISLV